MHTCHHLLCTAINKVAIQENARDALHAVLYAMRKAIGAERAFIAVKDRTTDTLRIISQVDVPETARRAFTRGIGSGAIARVFFEENCLTVSRTSDPAGYKELLLAGSYGEVFLARIATAGRAFGLVAAYFPDEGMLDDDTRDFLRALADLAALALEKERNRTLLDELRQVNSDTGLLYYDHFQHLLRAEFDKTLRYQQPMALALIDIDNYKEVLRADGQAGGLQLCREVIEELRRCTRGVDVIAHFGVDEFIIYLPNTDRKGAEIVFRRFRDRLKRGTYTGRKVGTSASIGLTVRQHGVPFTDFLQNCQIALAAARRAGKGQFRYHA